MQEHKFLLFGDNIWEARSIIENIIKYLGPNSILNKINKIKLEGCPALPIYSFNYGNHEIIIRCLGNYPLWINKFPIVKSYLDYFDRPDVVLYYENKNKIIAAGEFTETVSVGNSQWQRAQRSIAAALLKIPFLNVYGFGEDRSQTTLRESSAILTYYHLKISADNQIPFFMIFKDSLYLMAHNRVRAKKGLKKLKMPYGDKIIGEWFGLRLLNSIERVDELKKLESIMVNFMFDNIYYDVKKNKKIKKIIDNDLPEYNKYLNNTRKLEEIKKIDFKKFCTFKWNLSGKDLNKSHFKKNVFPLIKNYFRTYNPQGKFAVADKKYTKKTEDILINKYPPKKQIWERGYLDYNKPIVLIPLQVWKKNKNKYGYSDPNGGEAVLFPSLLDSLNFNSTSNIIYIFYGQYPLDWYPLLNKNNQKIFRAVNTIGKVLCVDNNGSDRGPESFKIIGRSI